MKSSHIVLWSLSWLAVALIINTGVQISFNQRPLTCPYCAYHHQHHLVDGHHHTYPTHPWYYAFAMTRHSNFHWLDEYSISHKSHGLLEGAAVFIIAGWSFMKRRYSMTSMLKWGYVVALALEVAWEFLENRPANLQYYDFKNMRYCGDTLTNSAGDVLSMALGYLLVVVAGWLVQSYFFQRLHAWRRLHSAEMFNRHQQTVTFRIKLVLLKTPLCVYTLLFALCMLLFGELYMFYSIKDGLLLSIVQYLWGVAGWPPMPALRWVHDARSKLVVLPGPKCHRY